MSIFSTADLQNFRDFASDLALIDDCLIERDTAGMSDGHGTSTEGLTTVTTVKCLASEPTAGQLATYAEKIGNLLTWQVRMPFGTDAREQDVLTINSQTMKVQADISDVQTYGIFTVVLASEVL
jgi:hypothetical protein